MQSILAWVVAAIMGLIGDYHKWPGVNCNASNCCDYAFRSIQEVLSQNNQVRWFASSAAVSWSTTTAPPPMTTHGGVYIVLFHHSPYPGPARENVKSDWSLLLIGCSCNLACCKRLNDLLDNIFWRQRLMSFIDYRRRRGGGCSGRRAFWCSH